MGQTEVVSSTSLFFTVLQEVTIDESDSDAESEEEELSTGIDVTLPGEATLSNEMAEAESAGVILCARSSGSHAADANLISEKHTALINVDNHTVAEPYNCRSSHSK